MASYRYTIETRIYDNPSTYDYATEICCMDDNELIRIIDDADQWYDDLMSELAIRAELEDFEFDDPVELFNEAVLILTEK